MPSKRRSKAYRPRIPNVPMMTEARDALALSMHWAIQALITHPTVETYNALSTKLSTLGYAGLDIPALEMAKQQLISICDRYERVGKIGVSDSEAARLRAAAPDLDAALGTIPINKMARAETVTALHCEAMGI